VSHSTGVDHLQLEFFPQKEGDRVVGVVGLGQDITRGVEAAQQSRMQEYMDRIAGVLAADEDFDTTITQLLTEIRHIFAADRSWLLFPCDPDAVSYRIPYSICDEAYPGAPPDFDIPMDDFSAAFLRRALECRPSVAMLADIHTDEAPPWIAQFHIRSHLLVVLQPRNERPWALGLHQCTHARKWNDHELRLFESIARRVEDTMAAMLAQRNQRDVERQLQRPENGRPRTTRRRRGPRLQQHPARDRWL
jgi:GAF domain-containing protein